MLPIPTISFLPSPVSTFSVPTSILETNIAKPASYTAAVFQCPTSNLTYPIQTYATFSYPNLICLLCCNQLIPSTKETRNSLSTRINDPTPISLKNELLHLLFTPNLTNSLLILVGIYVNFRSSIYEDISSSS